MLSANEPRHPSGSETSLIFPRMATINVATESGRYLGNAPKIADLRLSVRLTQAESAQALWTVRQHQRLLHACESTARNKQEMTVNQRAPKWPGIPARELRSDGSSKNSETTNVNSPRHVLTTLENSQPEIVWPDHRIRKALCDAPSKGDHAEVQDLRQAAQDALPVREEGQGPQARRLDPELLRCACSHRSHRMPV
jgi:hypothetical protein